MTQKVRIETPSGSGNFVEVYVQNGDMVLALDTKDPISQMRQRSSVTLFGLGKGEGEPRNVQRLYSALASLF